MKGIIKKLIPVTLAAIILFTAGATTEVSAKAKTHTVTFIYGTKMVTQQVQHGKNAVVPIDTAVPGYAFSSWIGSAVNVTEDRVILGAYNKDGYLNYATADSNVVVSKYGLPVFQPQPTVKINNNKTAPFPAWWNDLNIPKGVPGQTCAVHLYNGWNGEYWKTVVLPYGGSMPDPGNPCLSGFEFVGWEGDWTNVTEDRCIKAWYFVSPRVEIRDRDTNQLIDTQYIRKGSSIRTANLKSPAGYYVNSFSSGYDNIQGECTIYAWHDDDKD